jgi:flagellar basal body P-ring formation protein FlgA
MALWQRNQRDCATDGCGRRAGPRAPSVGFLARGGVLAAAMFAATGPSAATQEARWQAPDEIAAAAVAFVLDRFSTDDATLEPKAGPLDPRLKLTECEEPLEAFMQDGARLTSRPVVGVRCNGVRPWKIYVPIQIAVTDTVMTVGRPLPRGHVLTPDDVVAERRDVSRLAAGYVSRVEDLVGRRLKQQLAVGRVITPSLLDDEIIVKRGQSVTITAESGGLRIDMGGTALADGSLNERIRVQNDQSGRVIEAVVRSEEYVEVLTR